MDLWAPIKFSCLEMWYQNSYRNFSCIQKATRVPRVLVIGGGVVGMTSALQLLQKGYKVTVVAKEFASPVASGKCITSEIAGALWEWPPAVCGRHTDEKSLERSKVWCMDSYAKFMELAMKPKETGAYLRQSVFYFKNKVKAFSRNPTDSVYTLQNHRNHCCAGLF